MRLRSCAIIVGVAFLIIGGCSSAAFADSLTLAQVFVDANGSQRSTSDPHTALVDDNDISNAGVVTSGKAGATAAFGDATGFLDFQNVMGLDYPGSNTFSATYSLQVLSGASWVDILEGTVSDSGLTLADAFDQTLTGSYDFVTGVSYQLRGILSLSGNGFFSSGTATSLWADVLTFNGTGDAAHVGFSVELAGSILATRSVSDTPFPILPSSTGTYTNNSRLDVTAANVTAISIAPGIDVQSVSGSTYPVGVPEPGVATLLIAAAVFGGAARWTRFRMEPPIRPES